MGDTPADARRSHREKSNSRTIRTWHTGHLPQHTRWNEPVSGIEFIVLDELHTSRGVFGSHLGNVLRRLRRMRVFTAAIHNFICVPRPLPIRASGFHALLEYESNVP